MKRATIINATGQINTVDISSLLTEWKGAFTCVIFLKDDRAEAFKLANALGEGTTVWEITDERSGYIVELPGAYHALGSRRLFYTVGRIDRDRLKSHAFYEAEPVLKVLLRNRIDKPVEVPRTLEDFEKAIWELSDDEILAVTSLAPERPIVSGAILAGGHLF